MDARPAPDVYDDEPWELAAAYRVTLWEQPARPPNIDQPARGPVPFPGAPMGWEEMTFELAGAQDVREVIQWAETTLASGEGPASRRGVPVQDREYVIYAKAQSEDRWLHVAGWTPVLPSDSPLNLRRLGGHSRTLAHHADPSLVSGVSAFLTGQWSRGLLGRIGPEERGGDDAVPT